MCDLCDRAWLGMYNTRWGNAHLLYNKRYAGTWNRLYNEYHPRYSLERVNRSVKYDPRENSLKRFR